MMMMMLLWFEMPGKRKRRDGDVAAEHVLDSSTRANGPSDGAADENAVRLLDDAVADHFRTLRSFDPGDVIFALVAPFSSSQRSGSSKPVRIQRLMLAYLQCVNTEAESIRDELILACADLHVKLRRDPSKTQLQNFVSEIVEFYSALRMEIALRITIVEYESLGHPPDELTETLTKWDNANHQEVTNLLAQLHRRVPWCFRAQVFT